MIVMYFEVHDDEHCVESYNVSVDLVGVDLPKAKGCKTIVVRVPVGTWKGVKITYGGEANLVLREDDSCVLQWVYVVKDLRGNGIGTALVRKVIEVAREVGCRTVEAVILDVPGLTVPEAMRRILQKLGFEHRGGDEYVLRLR